MHHRIALLTVAAALIAPAAAQGYTDNPRQFLKLAKVSERAHAWAERQAEREGAVGYDRPFCVKPAGWRVSCTVVLRHREVDDAGNVSTGVSEWTYSGRSAFDASGHPITVYSVGPRLGHATGFRPVSA